METPAWTRHYQPGVPAEIELPTDSLIELLETAVKSAKNKTATVFFDAKMSYAQLGDRVNRVAEGLRHLGVSAGDRVAILLPNCPQHLIAFYAVLRLGAVVVEHNPLYTEPELEELFTDHGARVAIALDTVIPKLRQMPTYARPTHIVAVNLIKEFPVLKRIALNLPIAKLRKTRQALTNGDKGTVTWEKLLESRPISNRVPKPMVDDLAAIQYTSGTTGKSKGAMLTHYNLYANARQGEAWMHGAVDGEETSYAALPFFHSFGVTVHMTFGVLKQMRQVLFPKPEVEFIVGAIKKYPPTVYCAVPLLYERTALGAQEKGLSLKTAKYCISGATALPDRVRNLWESVSGGLLVEGYGLTETSPVAMGNPFAETRRPGTIGVPFPSTLMKVVDVADGVSEVGVNEPGELLLKGPQVTSGYWHDPESTREILTDGWLHTGDIVTVDKDGFTTIVDRKKEIIITGGFNVSPSEVEAAMLDYEPIADIAVIGIPSERGDEEVTAAVVLKEDAAIEDDEARKWAKQRLAAYKVPRHFVVVDEIPKTMLGKPMRRLVKNEILKQN